MPRDLVDTDRQDVVETEASKRAAELLAELEKFWGRAMVRLIARELLRLARSEGGQ